MFFYIVLTPISTTSGLWSTGNIRKYQQIDVYIYQCGCGTPKELRTSKGDYRIKQWFSSEMCPFLKWELLLKERICSQRGSKFFALRAVPYGMENHFYHIRWPPLNVTIFITHVRNCVMGDTPLSIAVLGKCGVHLCSNNHCEHLQFISSPRYAIVIIDVRPASFVINNWFKGHPVNYWLNFDPIRLELSL